MKFLKLLFFALFFIATSSHSQIKVDPITVKGNERFITTTIGYPSSGIYFSPGKKEPIIQLNDNGTGIFQLEDLSKKNISWGIECSKEGIPIFKEGFDSASYSLWYRSNENEDWISVQFSIHFNKKKMFIMGERVKDYVDYNDLKKPLPN